MELSIEDLHVEIEGKEIIRGLNLKMAQGETHVIMGPNGSGKSTLAKTIMGHPRTIITKGDIKVDGKSITGDEDGREGEARALPAVPEPS